MRIISWKAKLFIVQMQKLSCVNFKQETACL